MKNTPLSVLRRTSTILQQQEAAEKLGKPKTWYSGLESGRNEAPPDVLRKLAHVLGLSQHRVTVAALQTRAEWLREQEKRVASKLKEIRQSA